MRNMVITGGPCGGKTTALAHLERELEARGWSLVLVPECATSLLAANITPTTSSRLAFQTAVFELQLAQEWVFVDAARRLVADEERVLVVFDRGLMDGKGYLSDEEFDELLVSHGMTQEEAFARYEAVFHLESAAKGRTGAYTLENNATRMEDEAEAIRVDNRLVEAWEEHPRRVIIGSEDHFSAKVDHLMREVLAFLG